jgi:hypothetical protein
VVQVGQVDQVKELQWSGARNNTVKPPGHIPEKCRGHRQGLELAHRGARGGHDARVEPAATAAGVVERRLRDAVTRGVPREPRGDCSVRVYVLVRYSL